MDARLLRVLVNSSVYLTILADYLVILLLAHRFGFRVVILLYSDGAHDRFHFLVCNIIDRLFLVLVGKFSFPVGGTPAICYLLVLLQLLFFFDWCILLDKESAVDLDGLHHMLIV